MVAAARLGHLLRTHLAVRLGPRMTRSAAVPSARASAARIVALLESLLALVTQVGPRAIVADLDPAVAERRRKNREKVARWRAKNGRKKKPVTRQLPVPQHIPYLRGEKPRMAQVTTQVTGNPSLPRSPSLPKAEKRKATTKRPLAAERERGPVVALASFWGKQCRTAGVPSLLGGYAFKDLGTLLFAVCGKDLKRAQDFVAQYIRDCGHTRQTPTPRELLDMAPKTRVRNGASHIHVDNGALQKEAPGRKLL